MAAGCTGTDKSQLLKRAKAFQQNYYEICSDWNRYETKEANGLKTYIGYQMFGLPKINENKLKDDNLSNDAYFEYEYEKKKSIDFIFHKIEKYGKAKTEEAILCSCIYNILVKEEKQELINTKCDVVSKAQNDKNDTNKEKDEADWLGSMAMVCPVPVFKVKSNDQMIEKIYYIDSGGRVYDGFQDYLENNTLPKCTMVLPRGGKYQANPNCLSGISLLEECLDNIKTQVWLDVIPSPASLLKAQILAVGDMVSAAFAIAGLASGVAALFTPFSGVAFAINAICGIVSGSWIAGRGIQKLTDRGTHDESIRITDESLIRAWIEIVGGVAGLATTGSSIVLFRAIRAGTTVGTASILAYDAALVSNLVVNGAGTCFKSYNMYLTYKKNGKISPRDVASLTAHIFFFYNSVSNMRFAKDLILTSQGELLKEYESALRSNRHRKEFQRIARNTRASCTNDYSSNEEIIRGINNIANKDDVFEAMVRNHKTFSACGAKLSFNDGKTMINSKLTIDIIELSKLPKDERWTIVNSIPGNEISSNGAAGTITKNETSYKHYIANSGTFLQEFCKSQLNSLINLVPLKRNELNDKSDELEPIKNSNTPSSQIVKKKNFLIRNEIMQYISDQDKMALKTMVEKAVQFLWNYMKCNVKKVTPKQIFNDSTTYRLIDIFLKEFWQRANENVDKLVNSFKHWLVGRLINYPQMYDNSR